MNIIIMAMSADFFGDGSFDFITQEYSDGAYYRNAHWAITQTEMWNWLHSFSLGEKESFMFCTHPNLKIIEQKMYEQEIAHYHSGASFGITMRQMQYIAMHGYNAFRNLWIEKHSPKDDEFIPNVDKSYVNQINII